MKNRRVHLEMLWEDFANHSCEHMRRLAARKLGEVWAADTLARIEQRLRRIFR